MAADEIRLSQAEAHAYWRRPDDGDNDPRAYLDFEGDERKPAMRCQRSEALVSLVRQYLPLDATILEIGCNAGRNLKYLLNSGYRRLNAIEISAAAIDTMREMEPEVFAATRIDVGPIEEAVRELEPADAIVTMATLVHLPFESEWVFAEIARKVRHRMFIVEFEGEHPHPRMFPRRYRPIFEAAGLEQVAAIHPFPGMINAYVGRIFKPCSQTI